jgi:CheY-like chemotaxis protein
VTDRSATPASIRGCRILVVEDEPLIAMDIGATLSDAGCEVVGPAANLETARALVAAAEFDAALLDANLGGRPVDELAAALTRRNVPFVFLTGYGREGLPAAFRQAPMIGKPFMPEHALRVLAEVMQESEEAAPLRQEKT